MRLLRSLGWLLCALPCAGFISDHAWPVFRDCVLEADTDFSADPRVGYTIRYTYDMAGHLVRKQIDERGDGATEQDLRFTYADGPYPVLMEQLSDEGTVLERTRYVYHDDRLVREVTKQDGQPASITTYTYLEDRSLVLSATDADADGRIDARGRYVEYDGPTYTSNLLLIGEDRDADGRIDAAYSPDFDALGRLVQLAIDRNADGRDDSILSFDFDEEGRLRRTLQARARDRRISAVTTFAGSCYAP
jgi:hypothetical protein